MSNSKGYPIYKFASLRSPDFIESEEPTSGIAPDTSVVSALVGINENEEGAEEKMTSFNAELQSYVDSDLFVKSKTAFNTLKDENPDASAEYMAQLYNNVIVRTLTKSTSNVIYKKIVEELKRVYVELNALEEAPDIIIPSRLVPSFTEFTATPDAPIEDDSSVRATIYERLQDLVSAHETLNEARQADIVRFDSRTSVSKINRDSANILTSINESDTTVTNALDIVDTEISKIEAEADKTKTFNRRFETEASTDSSLNAEVNKSTEGIAEVKQKYDGIRTQLDAMRTAGITSIKRTETETTNQYSSLLDLLGMESGDFEEVESTLKKRMVETSKTLDQLVKKEQYSYVGEQWVNTSNFEAYQAEIEHGLEMLEIESNCEYKFPFRIADLRVVEQEPVGYLPGEIAHINNTQPGEKNTRVTRRLKKIESTESLFIEDETFSERDSQSTEKFSLEKEASSVQERNNAFSIKASAAAKFGAYSASVDANYSTSNSSTIANSTSQSEAREVVESIVERVSNLVRTERSSKTVEEFEETVTHEIDNSGEGTKSYVYRWLNKLVRATLKNYGKRLIFQFDVAHPAHYYLSRAIEELPTISLPEDPQKIQVNGSQVLTVDSITRDNYLAWAAMYKTQLPEPPKEKILVSDVMGGEGVTIEKKLLPIKANYECQKVRVSTCNSNGWPYHNFMVLTIGNSVFANWDGSSALWPHAELWLRGETEQLPISLFTGVYHHTVNLEIECVLTDEAYQTWKIQAYNAIVEAYQQLKNAADEELSSFNPNLPGLNPSKKEQLIRDEIKKETIRRMFRCNPFWVDDNFVVGREYKPNCCVDSLRAEKVRFLENTFDWDNMTYELHPYFYSNKASWAKLLELADNNPHFEAFLQASFATVQVPVHRDHLKEVAAVNFIKYNSLHNYETIPEDMEEVLEELDLVTPTMFTYDLEGNELPEPSDTVDLGVFNLPTSLVILECGTTDGVSPIGFPQSEEDPTSDVIIPKQYSPAIIADSCPPA